jgi:vacuolar-type H+-ATPase subunit D/Vma8
MIPRTLDNIRIIRIALGDAQTAAVARAKLAKSKSVSILTGKTGA